MAELRHFLNLTDFEPETLKGIVKNAHALKAQKFNPPQIFAGLTLAMMFDKRSTRTRMSFEVAMKQLGGHTLVMSGENMNSKAERPKDTANVLSRYVDAVMIRMSDHDMLSELASHASVPFINAMTDDSHPCQIMADMMTIEEKLGSAEGKKIAWFGDINNVSHTFVQAAPLFGFELVLSTPEDLQPKGDLGTNVSYTADAQAAAKDADVIVTDTWVSLGEEKKSTDKFLPYQVNAGLMAQAKDTAIFMHCLPAYVGNEVTEEVMDSAASVIYDEAENRLHAQKAVLAWCLENAGVSISQKSFNFGNV